MKRPKITDFLADHESRSRSVTIISPRLVRRQDAALYFSSPQLFAELEQNGWIKPVVSRHRLVLFDVNDILACVDRLKQGERPKSWAE